MQKHHKKIIVLTILLALLINYPWINLFSSQSMLFGIPTLYVFLFGIWLMFILLVRHYIEAPPEKAEKSSDISSIVNKQGRGDAAK